MATVDELGRQGVEKMRLPFWNEHAYITLNCDGTANLYDVGCGIKGPDSLLEAGTPLIVSIDLLRQHDEWVAHDE